MMNSFKSVSLSKHGQSSGSFTGVWSRRQFISLCAPIVYSSLTGCRAVQDKPESISDLQVLLENAVEDPRISGVSAALIQGNNLLWRGVAGFADLQRGIKLDVDHIQNIASISKTITATAVMQLVERGRLDLDQDVNNYLPFQVRNPKFPSIPISTRHLLAHRSSITDGSAYGRSYACGDPSVTLGVWVEEYLSPGGQYFNAEENFLSWEPGTENPSTPPRTYSNVAFGLLGHLIEQVSGQNFDDYCRVEIFDALGMKETRWKIGDLSDHAIPHTYLNKEMKLGPGESLEDHLVADSVKESDATEGAVIPHCLYSFYNYPDGLLRTNPTELSRFLRAYIGGGQFDGKRILKEETVKEMLVEQYEGQGLSWSVGSSSGGGRVFQHSGGDPGVSTFMAFRERDGAGAIVFFNCLDTGDYMGKILDGMFDLLNRLENESTN